jgi:hypothetical protein
MKPLHTDERFGVIIAIIVAVWVGFYFATPASHWLTIQKMDVQSAARWQDVTIDFKRTIHNTFTGQWVAKVRRKEPQGWVTYATTPVSTLIYQDDSQLPVPVTLEWMIWTEPRAYELPCGIYELAVTWTVHPNSWIFRRETTRFSRFIIWGEDECTE